MRTRNSRHVNKWIIFGGVYEFVYGFGMGLTLPIIDQANAAY